jgi:GAF domain-containing protein
MFDQDHHDRGDQPAARRRDATDPHRLVHQLSELARSMQAHSDTGTMLDEIVAAAVAMIPGADEGSISVITGRRQVTSQSPSGDLPRLVDAVQAEVGQGPCLDAVYQQQTVRVPDMATEQRWPDFTRRAAELGAASMLSFRLFVQADDLGALNLYSRHPRAFDEESERVGLLFAGHAAVAFAQAQKLDQLAVSVDTRDLIGQAKGILMERYDIDAVAAFATLVRASQHQNRKLRDLAEELARTGRVHPLP